MSWFTDEKDEKVFTQEEHDKVVKGIRERHADNLRDIDWSHRDEIRRKNQEMEDLKRSTQAEVATLKANHEVELTKRDQGIKATELVTTAETRATKAETEVAVLTAKLEAAGKAEEVGAEVLEAKEMISTIQGLTEKIIDKLPSIDISTISVMAQPAGQQNQKGNNGNDKSKDNSKQQ